MSVGKVFLDTNILIYAQDQDAERAIDRSVLSQISFWDALIVAASASSGCTTIYSEDLNAGQLIEGVRIENPFVQITEKRQFQLR